MNKLVLIFFILLFPGLLLAEVRISLSFSNNEIKQGELQEVELSMDFSAAQNFEIQRLKNTTPGDVLYIHKISPLLRSGTSGTLSGTASVVFINVPDANHVEYQLGDEKLILTWNNVKVIATDAKPVFIYEDFTVPSRKAFNSKLLITGLIILLLIPVVVFIVIRYRKLQAIKLKRRRLKESLLSGNSYDEVVKLWKSKSTFLHEFPTTEAAFKNLESVLFKYQFKPSQNEQEKNEVMKAYRAFSDQIRETLHGI